MVNDLGETEKLLNWVLPKTGTGKADELGEEAFVVLTVSFPVYFTRILAVP